MKIKACILGGSGFLGSYVADALSKEGFDVIIYDLNKSKWLQKSQTQVIGSILDLELLTETISGCDFVFNFAALADLNLASEMPLESVNINVLGNVNALEACRINKVKKYMFASSVYVNSKQGGFYKASKQAAEIYIEEYRIKYGLTSTIMRYGSLYGPRSDKSNGIWRVINEALQSRKIRYNGDLEAMREYIHVADAAIASLELLDAKYDHQKIVLTGQEPMKVVDFLKMLAEILDISDEITCSEKVGNGAHYIRTPYSYKRDVGRKYMLQNHIDLGQGLLDLIHDLDNSGQNNAI